jgi:hypothetical protein
MISFEELRLGNFIMQKVQHRILTVRCAYAHFELASKGSLADLFPLVLKPEHFLKSGFVENKDYPHYPEAREFILVLPVIGSGKNELFGYMKNNKECFCRYVVNGQPAGNNLHHLHSLQNLYFALTGSELQLSL